MQRGKGRRESLQPQQPFQTQIHLTFTRFPGRNPDTESWISSKFGIPLQTRPEEAAERLDKPNKPRTGEKRPVLFLISRSRGSSSLATGGAASIASFHAFWTFLLSFLSRRARVLQVMSLT
ncbi:hypothetical protein MHYP_G00290860 [Metynnis hypsauchen]